MAYKEFENETIFEDAISCPDRDCKEYKVRDAISTLGTYFSFLIFNATNCSQFYTALYF